jgi:uncharacterized protein YndB with AHSA1/START domain
LDFLDVLRDAAGEWEEASGRARSPDSREDSIARQDEMHWCAGSTMTALAPQAGGRGRMRASIHSAAPLRTAMATTFAHERLIDASPEAVFAAIEDPARLAVWWGPDGFTNTFSVFEFQAGGRWTFTMHGPDGAHYPNQSEFTEVVPGRRVVVRHLSLPHFSLSIDLQAQGEGTRVEWRQVFDDDQTAAAVRHIVEPANEQNLARLAKVVESV